MVLAVEADNLDQRLYLPPAAREIEHKYLAFWQAAARANPSTHFRLGPELLRLLTEAELTEPRIEGFLTVQARRVHRSSFFSTLSERVSALATRYRVHTGPEAEALLDSIAIVGQECSVDAEF
jgi:hypothetical protein